MNKRNAFWGLVFATAVSMAKADDFYGSFSGLYAPANWTVAVSGNPQYQNSASVDISGAPNRVTLNGAIGENFTPDPETPSIIDYSIILPGVSARNAPLPPVLQPVSVRFNYTFFDPFASGGGNQPPAPVDSNGAEIFQNGTFLAFLPPGTSTFQDTIDFIAGDTLTIRLISGNTPITDSLTITPIPEPPTFALAGLGGAALLLQLRRKTAKH